MERLQFSRDKDNAKLKRIQEWSDIQRPIVYSVSLLSGFSCPSATDCQAWAIEDRVTGKRRLQDGKRAKFRCFSANQEVQYTTLYNQRKYNFDLVKKKSLEELEELRDNGATSTARYREVLKEIEVLYGTGETNSFGTNDIGILKEK